MLVQNLKDTEFCKKQLQIGKKDVSNELKDERALEHIRVLQKLIPSTKHFIRVKIIYSFKRNPGPGLTDLQKEPANQFLLCSIYSTRDKPNIASFTLNKHLLLISPIHYSKTRIAFIPIIPYSATDFNTIYSCI